MPPQLSTCHPQGSSAAPVGPFERAQLPSPAKLQGTVPADGIGEEWLEAATGMGMDISEKDLPSVMAVSKWGLEGWTLGLQTMGASKLKERSFATHKAACELLSRSWLSLLLLSHRVGWRLRAAASVSVAQLKCS